MENNEEIHKMLHPRKEMEKLTRMFENAYLNEALEVLKWFVDGRSYQEGCYKYWRLIEKMNGGG